MISDTIDLDLDEYGKARARQFALGFTFLPLRAFVTQLSALTDLVHAWTALNAPCLAPPRGKVVPLAPYRYRSQFRQSAAPRGRR